MANTKKTVKKTTKKSEENVYVTRIREEIGRLQKDSLYHSSAVKVILERIIDGSYKEIIPDPSEDEIDAEIHRMALEGVHELAAELEALDNDD